MSRVVARFEDSRPFNQDDKAILSRVWTYDGREVRVTDKYRPGIEGPEESSGFGFKKEGGAIWHAVLIATRTLPRHKQAYDSSYIYSDFDVGFIAGWLAHGRHSLSPNTKESLNG